MDTECSQYLESNYPHMTFRRDWRLGGDTMYRLGQCQAIVNSLLYLPLSEELRHRLMRVSLVRGAVATTAIEGNTLTEKDAQLILDSKPAAPPSRKYQETELRNVIEAFNAIIGDIRQGHVAAISGELVCSFNRMVGKDLGENYDGVPGRLRGNFVSVGRYHAPDYKYLPQLMEHFTGWLRREFHFTPDARPDFADSVVEAVVAHLYTVWIHPFADGNGRTARLVEFYILLRSGLPSICSHILSNHYNKTRDRYYQEIEKATATRDASGFISYAIEGFRDGLEEVMRQVTDFQLANAWSMYAMTTINAIPKLTTERRERLLSLARAISLARKYTTRELVAQVYLEGSGPFQANERSVGRDIEELVKAGVLLKNGDSIHANIDVLVSMLPERRDF